MRSYERLGDWVDANYKMFDDSEIGPSQSKWGCYSDDGKYVHIYPYKFTEFCNNIAHINEKQFLIGLKQHGLLKHLKNELKNTANINSKSIRVVSVRRLWVETIIKNQNLDKKYN